MGGFWEEPYSAGARLFLLVERIRLATLHGTAALLLASRWDGFAWPQALQAHGFHLLTFLDQKLPVRLWVFLLQRLLVRSI